MLVIYVCYCQTLLLQMNLAMTCKAFLRRYLLMRRVRARLDDQTAGSDARLHSLNAALALQANSIEDLELCCNARPRWILGLQYALCDTIRTQFPQFPLVLQNIPDAYPGPPLQLHYECAPPCHASQVASL